MIVSTDDMLKQFHFHISRKYMKIFCLMGFISDLFRFIWPFNEIKSFDTGPPLRYIFEAWSCRPFNATNLVLFMCVKTERRAERLPSRALKLQVVSRVAIVTPFTREHSEYQG